MFLKAIRAHFLQPQLRTHNLASGFLINVYGKVDEAVFQCVERPYELIFCKLNNEKSDLDEFVQMIFLVGERP
jgi:hypothetical protein